MEFSSGLFVVIVKILVAEGNCIEDYVYTVMWDFESSKAVVECVAWNVLGRIHFNFKIGNSLRFESTRTIEARK